MAPRPNKNKFKEMFLTNHIPQTTPKAPWQKFKKSLIDSDVNKRTAWWNEIVVYNTKIIDMFVMQRVLDNSVLAKVEIEKLLSTASGSKPITIGSPAQFRKWFKERKGKIHKG